MSRGRSRAKNRVIDTRRKDESTGQKVQCSVSNGPCCNGTSCQFLGEETICEAASLCRNASHCSGSSAQCPQQALITGNIRCPNNSTCLDGEFTSVLPESHCFSRIASKFRFCWNTIHGNFTLFHQETVKVVSAHSTTSRGANRRPPDLRSCVKYFVSLPKQTNVRCYVIYKMRAVISKFLPVRHNRIAHGQVLLFTPTLD